MKHALVTLIVVILFVIIVVPLIYIALGKLKNPIDLFALNKIATNPTAAHSKFVSTNYVPDPNNGRREATPYDDLQKQVNVCFGDMDLAYGSGFTYKQEEGVRTTISNNQTGMVWVIDNFDFQASDNISRARHFAYFISENINPECYKDQHIAAKMDQYFQVYVDSDAFIRKIYDPEKYSDSSRFDITERGTSMISGLEYYWYLFEDKNRLQTGPNGLKIYQVVFGNYDDVNHRVRNFTMQGSSEYFKSARDFLRQSQIILSGVKYGKM